MSNLPVKIYDRTIQVKKRQGMPRSWPVEQTKRRSKLFNAMGVSNSFRQQVEITGLGNHRGDRHTKKRVRRAKNQRRPGCRKGTTNFRPGSYQRLVERRKINKTEKNGAVNILSGVALRHRSNQKDMKETQPNREEAKRFTH